MTVDEDVEVTPEMLEAGVALLFELDPDGNGPARSIVERIYRAMFAVSPQRKELEDLEKWTSEDTHD